MDWNRLFGRSRAGEDLNSYLDGTLRHEERGTFERRLASDPTLQEELEGLQLVKTLVASLGQETPPRSFALELADVTRTETGRPSLPAASRFAFAAAACAAVVAGVITVAAPSADHDASQATVASEAYSQDAADGGAGPPELVPVAGAEKSVTTGTAEAAPQPVPAPRDPSSLGEDDSNRWLIAQVIALAAALAAAAVGAVAWARTR